MNHGKYEYDVRKWKNEHMRYFLSVAKPTHLCGIPLLKRSGEWWQDTFIWQYLPNKNVYTRIFPKLQFSPIHLILVNSEIWNYARLCHKHHYTYGLRICISNYIPLLPVWCSFSPVPVVQRFYLKHCWTLATEKLLHFFIKVSPMAINYSKAIYYNTTHKGNL